jgi:L-alanine-DL-glutamate epimerase-like enolase superfamily enzyme
VPAKHGIKAQVLVYRVPIEVPVQTSFGIMHDRPSLLIRLEDGDGFVGWGEVWCNFPSVGAEHRARLLEATILPLASELGGLDDPGRLWTELTARVRVLAIQTGEHGPLNQCIAGFECALQDLAARRVGEPLWRYLAPDADATVAVYASGINPTGAAETVQRALEAGHTACKLKVGFGRERDRQNLHAARGLMGPNRLLMADANQGWTLDEALEFAPVVNEMELGWLEEPLAHDAPDSEWRALADSIRAQVAAGENFSSAAEFNTLPKARRVTVLQPDLGKWGGVAQAMRVAKAAQANGAVYCPHWLGGGVGLLTSLHVKAAVGGAGSVEVDVNPNPMLSALSSPVLQGLRSGHVQLLASPGIGDIDAVLKQFSARLTVKLECSI